MLLFLLFLSCAFAFLIGSIPTGFIAGKLHKLDIRKFGSGNIGGTNVERVLGKSLGRIVIFLDALKGFFVVTFFHSITVGWIGSFNPTFVIGRSWPHELFHVALAASVIAGHIWSVFLRFKGGKGVATTLGVLVGIDWLVAVIAVVVFGVVKYFTRYVSLGSLLGVSSAVIASLVLQRPASFVIFMFFATIVIGISHRENIARLKKSTEHKS